MQAEYGIKKYKHSYFPSAHIYLYTFLSTQHKNIIFTGIAPKHIKLFHYMQPIF